MKLSIIIVNWNSKDFLRACLKSIKDTCSELTPEVIVVDGGSYDGCSEMLAREFRWVEFIQSPENLGFAKANNLGFKRATGDCVLFLNPDTEIRPGAIQSLVTEIHRCSAVGILGPRLLNTDGSLQKSCVRALPTPLNRALDSELLRRLFPNSRLWGVSEAFQSSCAVEVEAVSGACMLLRSEIFRRVGGFTEAFFMYAEDMDLCAKVGRLDMSVYHVPHAEILHHGGGSSRTQVSRFKILMMRIAGETYMRLNHGRSAALLFRLLQALSAIVRLTAAVVAWSFTLGPRRATIGASIKKWTYVLQWALGLSHSTLPKINGSLLGSNCSQHLATTLKSRSCK